jgi:hypothetical protein
LTVEQVKELHHKLTVMRHDINNHLSLIVAALELCRHRPETAERMLGTLAERPAKIHESVVAFSADFDRALGIHRA